MAASGSHGDAHDKLRSLGCGNEARYFKNRDDHVFTVEPAAKAKKAIDWEHRILKEERDIVIASPPLRGDYLPS